jgi:Subtilase family
MLGGGRTVGAIHHYHGCHDFLEEEPPVSQQKILNRLMVLLGGFALCVTAPALARTIVSSIGEAGIGADKLHAAPYNLTGRKIAIGQMEIGRPARFGVDKIATNNRLVRPDSTFFRDTPAATDEYVEDHSASVASVMISQDKRFTGVAPNAKLYASAAGFEQQSRSQQPLECVSAQTVALQNGDDVRAINFSFGESLERDPREDAMLDGNALLTQCIDWSAKAHNTLYVIAGNQGRGGIPIPTDNYNGVVVANSMLRGGVFRKINFFSLGSNPSIVIGRDPRREANVDGRRSVSIVAPGDRLRTIGPDGSVTAPETGTSFAAPHVAATVALMQEYGDTQIRNALKEKPAVNHWGLNARQHEVMKAVLMNSADKIKDKGDGMMLGMTRTLLDLGEKNWMDSDAYSDRAIPIDSQMGAGHLHAFRAYEQFSPGQWNSDAPVPAIAWDYSSVGAKRSDAPRYRDYVIDASLPAGSFVSATLAWDRSVSLDDENGNKQYDMGESFTDNGLNNLDIYLMRAEDNDTKKSIWSSVSEVDSVEHIFHPVPTAGQYKIRVVYRDRANESVQPYALAWWAAGTK